MAAPAHQPDYCSLAQAVLWIAEAREPIAESDFESCLRPKLPEDPKIYNELIRALRAGKIHAQGTVVQMVEDVVCESNPFKPTESPLSPAPDQVEIGTRPSGVWRQYAVWQVCDVDTGVTPKPHEWAGERVNWRHGFLDLNAPIQASELALNLTPFAREWQRLTSITVCLADLKLHFPRPIAAQSSGPQPGKKSLRGRGRLPEYNWPAFDAEFIRQRKLSPKLRQVELERAMADWCDENWPKTPGHTAMSDRIRRLWNAPAGSTGN